MAEEQKEGNDLAGRKDKQQRDSQQKNQQILLDLRATINNLRQVVVVVFVTKGGQPCGGCSVTFFCGDAYQQVGQPHQTDPSGKATTVVGLGLSVHAGPLLLSAKADGMPSPVSTVVEVPELAKPETREAIEFKIEPTFAGYNDQGHAQYSWTPRAFDAKQRSITAKLHIVGSRPFYLQKQGEPHSIKGDVFELEVPEEIKTHKITIDSPGLIEIDVAMEGAKIEDNNLRLRGSRRNVNIGPESPSGASRWEQFWYGFWGGKRQENNDSERG